ncbi:cell division protein FtsQ [Spinactinospora alkalitolerans]|uniref:Cell division protein FtsQ n=1 Tax=Spinactinospora alkalitolerans TaxID=687207 RepID=A0A852TZ84_9ACTN|nr:FtsQ-type POTRA domain-containing protein [Spinactinospora alkalitolerans]NYE48617.1 cell division protein FtsQ [Spinactinospora alkalitolerans]
MEGSEEAVARARRSDPWKAAFVVLLIVAVLAVVTWVLLGSRLLVVRDVEVTGAGRLDSGEVVSAVDVRTGTPLARVDTAAAAARAEELRLVESATVSRGWPATLRVEVVERTPALSVRVGDGYRLVDHDGVHIEDTGEPSPGHPLVSVTGEVEGNPAVAEAAAVVEGLPAAILDDVEEIEATDRSEITLRLGNGASVMWGDSERTEKKAGILEILMREHPPSEERRYDVSASDVAVVK